MNSDSKRICQDGAAIPRRPVGTVVPLSYGQKQLWFIQQLASQSIAYNVGFSLKFEETIDCTALERAVNEIVRRHEVLRTQFATVDAQPVQVVAEELSIAVNREHLGHLTAEDGEAALGGRLSEEVQRPFNLDRPPLIRVHLFDLGAGGQVLLIVTHHIIWDGWSQKIFIHELEVLYKAYAQGQEPSLGELPIQYGDYAHWQAELARQGRLQDAVEYWRRHLAAVPQSLDIPTDFSRPIVPTFEGASRYFQIPAPVTQSLKSLSRGSGATLYMTLLGAYGLLLWRYSLQEQILIGTPTANRKFEELQRIIGLFVNVLVMRIDLKRNFRFAELLKRVRETALDAYANQDVPFEFLIEELRPERSLNRTPLFQTMFVMQDGSLSSSANQFMNAKLVAVELPVAKFDLSLGMREADGTLVAELNYNTSLFAPGTIERLQKSFVLLLEQISRNPLLRLNDLAALVSPEEKAEIEAWNSTRADYGPEERLHVLFESQVRSSPEKLALICGKQGLTYFDLNRRANQLARHLQRRGIGPEACVGVCMERSVEMVVALLAVLKAGAAYLPLDPEYPKERLHWMQADARVPVTLVQQRFVHILQPTDSEVICLDDSWALVSEERDDNCTSSVSGENVAYVIYTSGSTGKPKGVMNRHSGICNRLLWMQKAYQLDSNERVLQKTPYSFDVSVWEFFWPLITGACLVMTLPGGHRDTFYLKRTIQEEKITTIHFVPSMLKSMLENEGLRECPSLRRVLCSGEALGSALAEQFHRQCGAELHNLYGPTEAAVDVTYWECTPHSSRSVVPIGRPIANTQIYVIDGDFMPVPVLMAGELCIGGEGLSRGYLNRPDLTAEKFIPNPFGQPGSRLYRTGDLARYAHDGMIEYLGRIDFQVKIRGNRIELAEIEEVLKQSEHVQDCALVAQKQADGEKKLIAFVAAGKNVNVDVRLLRAYLKERLPDFMVPAKFVFLEKLPVNSNGKLDRKALKVPQDELSDPTPQQQSYVAPRNDLEQKILRLWVKLLRAEHIGVNDNFFDLGGHSLALIALHSVLRETLQIEVPVLDLFRYPTIAALASYLTSSGTPKAEDRYSEAKLGTTRNETTIAIIGMAGRFPGARNIEELWENLKNGVESVSFFSDSDLSHVPEDLRTAPNYVRAAAILDDAESFDAEFFGFRRLEAETTDPQQRVFLECAWEVLERAGYDPERYWGPVGVFAGAGASGYWHRLSSNPEILKLVNSFQLNIANDKDHLPLRVSYKLNLKGPSVSVQTACSTSLVAVHMACQSLLQGECKMAMAGGVSIRAVQKTGSLYQEGGITSPDGHCRAFDADAGGTVSGNGAGVVLLKKLEDAIADGDHIHAVILGSAINNDGALKVGYTAPGIQGQADVIARAHARAGVAAESITYVEAHGTATPLGDPIEVAALTQAFQLQTSKKQFCAIGSVKTNVGHLDAAAGVTGLIKTALSLEHHLLPPTLHFRRPNPKIDFSATPFYVNSELRKWKHGPAPRRAGVSSFGIGGTNVHAVLEEAPQRDTQPADETPQILPLSCKTEQALYTATQQLAAHLKEHDEQRICDVAFTLQEGRREFPFRRAIVCVSRAGAVQAMEASDSWTAAGVASTGPSPVYFLFPGQGAQYVNMARSLYEAVPFFRRQLDRCAGSLEGLLRSNPLRLLYPEPGDEVRLGEDLLRTENAQPILFMVEHALASLWMEMGLRPQGLLGHSLGEYVAACVAGVMSLDDGLRLIAVRGRLMQNMPPGAMLSVVASDQVIGQLLDRNRDITLAAVNGHCLYVVSGPTESIFRVEQQLQEEGLEGRRLRTSHAFHSPMMMPVARELKHLLKQIKLEAPSIPFLSNLTGDWITPEQATSPDYWADHLLHTVHFSDDLQQLFKEPQATLLEAGPETVTMLARRHPGKRPKTDVVASIRPGGSRETEYLSFLSAVGHLWTQGNHIRWSLLGRGADCKRVILPTYPLERHRYAVPRSSNEVEAAPAGRHSTTGEPPSIGARSEIQGNTATDSTDSVHKLILQQLEIVAGQLNLLSRQIQ